MQDRPEARRPVRARSLSIGALLFGIALCWILLTPPGAGPDEPGHLTRSGAVARGDLDGVGLGELSLEAYDLPDSYLVPEPGCYAFEPQVPVSCAPPVDRTGATVSLASRADEYPIWGHLTFGLASRLPGLAAVWWARLAGATVAAALTGVAIVHGRRPLVAAGVVAATTPMAWSTYAQVNPSAFGIAGAVAIWTSLLVDRDDRTSRWLFAAGWVALALPRRDGLIWACVILAVMLVVENRSARSWWSRLGRGPQFLVAASTLATVVWGLTSDRQVSRMVALSPLVILAVEGWRWSWQRFATTRRSQIGVATGGTIVVALGTALVLRARPGGWDTGLARTIVGQTGTHLIEAVGVLGWLDTRLPGLAVIGWVAVIGLLVAAATATGSRAVLVAAAALTVLIVASWVFELYQGNTSGRYWQGRYSLPVLCGIPIVLATAPVPEPIARRVAWTAGGAALVIVNVAAWSAARRWGVGVEGSLVPWEWATEHSPIEPFVVLVGHAVLTTGLAVMAFGDASGSDDQPQRLTPSVSTT